MAFISRFTRGSGNDPEPATQPEQVPAPVDVGTVCDIGAVRQVNQDRVLAMFGDATPPNVDGVFVVSDGMGGHAAGEVAAQMAVDGVQNRAGRLTGAQFVSSLDIIRNLIKEVNVDVHTASFQPGQQGMGATLTVCALAGPTIVIGHIGDSRAYLLREGVLTQITPDHSWVMEMVARGMLTREQAETHPRRNVLTRALGIDRQADVHADFVTALAGDALLICSDGLHGVVAEAEIARVMTQANAQDACERLAQMANQLGGPDNIGIVIARINRLSPGPLAHAADALPASAVPSPEEGAAVTITPGGS